MNENRDPWGNLNRPQDGGPRRPWEESTYRFGGSVPPVPPAPPGPNLRSLLRRNANCIGLALVMVFAFGPVLRRLIWLIPGLRAALIGLPPVLAGIFNMSMFALALLIPTVVILRILGIPLQVAFPMRRTPASVTVPGVFCTLGMSVLGVFTAVILTMLISMTTGATPSMPDFSPPAYGTVETVIFLISISVLPAIFEELLFRGVIMQSLRRFGDPFALVCSSILFAMLHRNFIQGPNALLAGLVLGYFTLRAGSLIPAMVAHFVNNFLAGSMGVAMARLPEHHAHILNLSIIPAYIILGAAGLVFISLRGGFPPMRQALTGLREWQKYLLFFTSPLALVFILATIWETAQFVG